jgi:hypothetical protein
VAKLAMPFVRIAEFQEHFTALIVVWGATHFCVSWCVLLLGIVCFVTVFVVGMFLLCKGLRSSHSMFALLGVIWN